MADEQARPGGTPGNFINDIEAGVRQDFSARLESARKQVRDARDKAAAEKICSQKATEEMTRRMAEYRRGRWYDVGAVVTSAASGFTAAASRSAAGTTVSRCDAIEMLCRNFLCPGNVNFSQRTLDEYSGKKPGQAQRDRHRPRRPLRQRLPGPAGQEDPADPQGPPRLHADRRSASI
jgi:hypothetical protein